MLPDTLVTFISTLEKSGGCWARIVTGNRISTKVNSLRMDILQDAPGSLSLEVRMEARRRCASPIGTAAKDKRSALDDPRKTARGRYHSADIRRLVLVRVLRSGGDERGLGGGPRPGRTKTAASRCSR